MNILKEKRDGVKAEEGMHLLAAAKEQLMKIAAKEIFETAKAIVTTGCTDCENCNHSKDCDLKGHDQKERTIH